MSDTFSQAANGTIIRAESFFTKTDGTQEALGELIFETDRVQSRYRGDRGVAAYAPSYDAFPNVAGVQARAVNAHGYGRLTDLAVAASQELRVADTIAAVQTAMAATAGDGDAITNLDIPTVCIAASRDGLSAANDKIAAQREAA